jgi:hypothetical protein
MPYESHGKSRERCYWEAVGCYFQIVKGRECFIYKASGCINTNNPKISKN